VVETLLKISFAEEARLSGRCRGYRAEKENPDASSAAPEHRQLSGAGVHAHTQNEFGIVELMRMPKQTATSSLRIISPLSN
jgi:hypothetical protein